VLFPSTALNCREYWPSQSLRLEPEENIFPTQAALAQTGQPKKYDNRGECIMYSLASNAVLPSPAPANGSTIDKCGSAPNWASDRRRIARVGLIHCWQPAAPDQS
jgi:hypothetical protein